MVVYMLFEIGFSEAIPIQLFHCVLSTGTSPLLRSYIARMSGVDQRTKAYAVFNTVSVLSVIIGPGWNLD